MRVYNKHIRRYPPDHKHSLSHRTDQNIPGKVVLPELVGCGTDEADFHAIQRLVASAQKSAGLPST